MNGGVSGGASGAGAALATAAEALVGSRYRLHGRDPATGLDCVGLLAAALAAIGRTPALPMAYGLRLRTLPALDGFARACGLGLTDDSGRPGDVQLVRVGACQFHLLIAGHAGRFIHAHAGLRRVVVTPGPPGWPVIHRWHPI